MSRSRLLSQLSQRAAGSVLRQVATPVLIPNIHTQEMKKITRQLVATLNKADAVGIAAPQVGLSMRIFVAQLDDAYQHDEEEPDVTTANVQKESRIINRSSRPPSRRTAPVPSIVINPVIHRFSTRKRLGLEGCLSLPDLCGELARPTEIDVSYIDENGQLIKRTLKDFRARIFQHELDHLNGKLFIDHIQDIRHIFTVRKQNEIEHTHMYANHSFARVDLCLID